MSTIQTLNILGRKFVLLPEKEFHKLTGRTVAESPRLPMPSSDGVYPAAGAMRAMMARKIIAARKAVGLSQAALARSAGIRVETLNRLEKGRHTPDLRTMAKINKALDAAGAPE